MFTRHTARARRSVAGRLMPLALTGVVLMAGVQLAGTAAGEGCDVSAVMIDAADGGVLYEQAADTARAPADSTRLMALYLAFEALDAGRVRLSDPLPSEPGQAPATVADGVRAMATGASAGLAGALARRLWGSEAAFADQMSQRARALGMPSSHFVNLTGQPDPRQVTSARDMATLVWSLSRDFPRYAAALDQPVGAHRPGLLTRLAPASCLVTGARKPTCRRTRVQAPGQQVIAVMLGAPTARPVDVRAIAAIGTLVARQALQGRVVTLAGLPAESLSDPATADVSPGRDEGLKIVVINRPSSARPATAHAPEAVAVARNATPAGTPAAPDALLVDPIPTPVAVAARDRWAIQVGAYASAEEARVQLSGLAGKLPEALGPLPQRVERAPGGLYRARFAAEAPDLARAACREVHRAGQPCMALALGQTVAG